MALPGDAPPPEPPEPWRLDVADDFGAAVTDHIGSTPHERWMILEGILLEILAAAVGTVSKQMIACSAHSGNTGFWNRWLFHMGAFLNVCVGPLLDASAYAFAPQVVVAPFACLDVLFNMLAAPFTLRWQQERITLAHMLGTVLVAGGACLTAVAGAAQDNRLDVYELEKQLLRPASLGYMMLELVLIIAVTVLLRKRVIQTEWRGVALGCVAGVLMGNVFFMKGLLGIIATSIGQGDWEAFLRPTPYLMLAAAVGGAVYGHVVMRKGLAEYKGVFMVTVFEGAHITAACLSGCVVMSELQGLPWWRIIGYWCALSIIILGILVVNRAAGASTNGGGAGERTASLQPRLSSLSRSFSDRSSGFLGDQRASSFPVRCAPRFQPGPTASCPQLRAAEEDERDAD